MPDFGRKLNSDSHVVLASLEYSAELSLLVVVGARHVLLALERVFYYLIDHGLLCAHRVARKGVSAVATHAAHHATHGHARLLRHRRIKRYLRVLPSH